MNIELFNKLIERETAKVDFKQEFYKLIGDDSVKEWDEFFKDIIALTNGNISLSKENAYLIFGVSDSTQKIGINIENLPYDYKVFKNVTTFYNKLDAVVSPCIQNVTFNFYNFENKDFLIIMIPPSPYVHKLKREITTKVKNNVITRLPAEVVLIRRTDGEQTYVASDEEKRAIQKEKDIFFNQKNTIKKDKENRPLFTYSLKEISFNAVSSEELFITFLEAQFNFKYKITPAFILDIEESYYLTNLLKDLDKDGADIKVRKKILKIKELIKKVELINEELFEFINTLFRYLDKTYLNVTEQDILIVLNEIAKESTVLDNIYEDGLATLLNISNYNSRLKSLRHKEKTKYEVFPKESQDFYPVAIYLNKDEIEHLSEYSIIHFETQEEFIKNSNRFLGLEVYNLLNATILYKVIPGAIKQTVRSSRKNFDVSLFYEWNLNDWDIGLG